MKLKENSETLIYGVLICVISSVLIVSIYFSGLTVFELLWNMRVAMCEILDIFIFSNIFKANNLELNKPTNVS